MLLTRLSKLCTLDGVSGCEGAVREYILSEVRPYADEVRVDSMGNVMALRRGRKMGGKCLMLAAHMDEVGFIVKRITDEGMLKFGVVGGMDPRILMGKRVRVGEEKIPGIIGIKAVHLTTAEERRKVPTVSDMYIDIGATSRADAEKDVALGDYIAFDSDFYSMGDRGFVKGKAIDDRAGCAVLLELIRQTPACDTWFVFTVQEEVGLRGAQIAAHALRPDIALVLEGTTAADLPNVDAHKRVCSAGAGVVIGIMDRGTIYDAELTRMLREICEEKQIKWQYKQYTSGGTDAGKIHLTGAGVRTCVLAAAVRYLHSPVCVASLHDIEAMEETAREFINRMGEME